MLLVLEGHLLLKELPDLPDLAVGQPPGGGGDHQVVPARLEVVDDTLMALRHREISSLSICHFRAKCNARF